MSDFQKLNFAIIDFKTFQSDKILCRTHKFYSNQRLINIQLEESSSNRDFSRFA